MHRFFCVHEQGQVSNNVYRYYTDNIAELSGEQEQSVIVESEESVLVEIDEESHINVTLEDENSIEVVIEDVVEGVDLGCC